VYVTPVIFFRPFISYLVRRSRSKEEISYTISIIFKNIFIVENTVAVKYDRSFAIQYHFSHKGSIKVK
jgi:hypothetical protein